MFEHCLSGDGAVFLSQNENSKDVADEDRQHIAPVRATKHVQTLGNAPKDKYGDGVEDFYDMIFDIVPWPKDQERERPIQPAELGYITLQTEIIGGDEGLAAPVVKVPLLDQLCEAINTASAGAISISSLYTSTVNLRRALPSTAVVSMKNASLLAQLADAFDKDAPFHLTFRQSLGSDIVLPVLFQELQVDIDENTPTGALFEFSPGMRGCIGQR